MNLRDFIHKNEMSIKYMAEQIECSASYLSMIALGKKKPRKRIQKLIENFTLGAVTAEDLEEYYHFKQSSKNEFVK